MAEPRIGFFDNPWPKRASVTRAGQGRERAALGYSIQTTPRSSLLGRGGGAVEPYNTFRGGYRRNVFELRLRGGGPGVRWEKRNTSRQKDRNG